MCVDFSYIWILRKYEINDLHPHQTGVSESLIRRGGGAKWPTRGNQLYRLFLPYQGTIRTQKPTLIGSENSLGPSMDPTEHLKQIVPDTIVFKPISGCVYHFYIVPYLALKSFWNTFLVIMKLYQCSRDPPGPQYEPSEAKIRGPLIEKGPSWSKLTNFFYIGCQTTNKLKFTAWFEINLTFDF